MALETKIKRSDLFSIVSQAHSLIEKRNIIPILSKVLIEAKTNRILIRATDQDNSLQSTITAKVKNPGIVVVDAQNLFEILKELPEGEIELKSDAHGKKLRLNQEASVFQLLCLNIKDFPEFPPFHIKSPFTIAKEDLREMIERTLYCASMDETRYHLTGVFFENISKGKKNFFRFAATDGHRLGLMESTCSKKILEEGVIISKKGVQEIRKLISYSETKEVEISVEKTRVLFRIGATILSAKLVEGTYPDYQPLIPKECSVKVKVNAEQFSQTLRRVALLSNSRFKGVTFQIKDKLVQMEAEHPEMGSAKDEVNCLEKEGIDLKVRFNARYLLEALATVKKENVLMEFSGKDRPVLIRADEKQDLGLAVIMPMKI